MLTDGAELRAVRAPRRAALALGAIFTLLAGLGAVLHPAGDAPDEAENLAYVDHLVRTGRLGKPGDGLRQAVHPPLSFLLQSLTVAPLEAIAPALPEKVIWPWGLQITIPLNQPSQLAARGLGPATRPGPATMHASTILGLRWLSAVLGGIGVAFMALAAQRLLPDRRTWALGAAAFLGLTPTLVIQCGAVAMEPTLFALCGWAALECARGVRDGARFSPIRLGLACGLAMLARHAGAAVAAAAMGVLWIRMRRSGRARAAKEAVLTAAAAAACLAPWLLYNVQNLGAPIVVREFYETLPEMLRASPASASDFDSWTGEVLKSYFGIQAAGVAPLEFFFVMWALLLGGALAGAVGAWRAGGDERARLAPLLAMIAPAAAVTLAIPFAGHAIAHQAQGRYLIPAVPFAVPLLALGFGRALSLTTGRRAAFALAAIPAAASGIMLLFTLAPLFAPRASRLQGALAYADCGGAYDPGRERGYPQRIPNLLLFPGPQSDVVIEFEKVVYRFPMTAPNEPIWLHVGLIGGSIGRPSIPAFHLPAMLDHAFPACRIRAGETVIAEFVSPPAESVLWSFPIPAAAIVGGELRLEFERVGTAPILAVSEIRVDTEGPSESAPLGPAVRVCAADARAGAGTRVADSSARSGFVRRTPIDAQGSVAETPRWSYGPGRYAARARVRVNDGPSDGPVALLIAGNADQPISAIHEIRYDAAAARRFRIEEVTFEVPAGTRFDLTSRVEVNGRGNVDVDDLEIVGPLR